MVTAVRSLAAFSQTGGRRCYGRVDRDDRQTSPMHMHASRTVGR